MKKQKDFLTIDALSAIEITGLLKQANNLLINAIKPQKILTALAGTIVAALFFEPSTRTLSSFTIAAHRLGAYMLNQTLASSSVAKGESLIDTAKTLAAMGVDILVLRHPENNAAQQIAKILDKTSIINAGDGSNQHPTQALADLLTIQQHNKAFESLRIAIVGDIAHSRVANSLIQALCIMKTPTLHLIGPTQWVPSHHANLPNVKIFHDLNLGLKNIDVIYCLRIQKERQARDFADIKNYFNAFGITKKTLSLANKGAIIMHPGPMNRGVEIASDVADCKQSVVLQQVLNGIAIRMAIMKSLVENQAGRA